MKKLLFALFVLITFITPSLTKAQNFTPTEEKILLDENHYGSDREALDVIRGISPAISYQHTESKSITEKVFPYPQKRTYSRNTYQEYYLEKVPGKTLPLWKKRERADPYVASSTMQVAIGMIVFLIITIIICISIEAFIFYRYEKYKDQAKDSKHYPGTFWQIFWKYQLWILIVSVGIGSLYSLADYQYIDNSQFQYIILLFIIAGIISELIIPIIALGLALLFYLKKLSTKKDKKVLA